MIRQPIHRALELALLLVQQDRLTAIRRDAYELAVAERGQAVVGILHRALGGERFSVHGRTGIGDVVDVAARIGSDADDYALDVSGNVGQRVAGLELEGWSRPSIGGILLLCPGRHARFRAPGRRRAPGLLLGKPRAHTQHRCGHSQNQHPLQTSGPTS